MLTVTIRPKNVTCHQKPHLEIPKPMKKPQNSPKLFSIPINRSMTPLSCLRIKQCTKDFCTTQPMFIIQWPNVQIQCICDFSFRPVLNSEWNLEIWLILEFSSHRNLLLLFLTLNFSVQFFQPAIKQVGELYKISRERFCYSKITFFTIRMLYTKKISTSSTSFLLIV